MSGAAGPSPTSTTTATSAKVSKFAVKSGFVIPKNKLSGSLVPIYRDTKSAGDDAATKESNKQLHRKTKWGPDPTQDAAVRKGRALAYQTRVDQIVQQLKSGKLDFNESLDTSSAAEQLDEKSLSHDSKVERKSKLLELEKMEIIGEILKLNANYKAPPDYKPLLKEDRLTIPVKEFPGYNFVGLIFGPGGDNRKRLEKETGAKIQVYGIEPGKDKGEVIPSDANDFQGYDEIYVQVSAETFEKVDSAVSIIELLISSVSGNLAGASTLSADNKNTHNAASSQAPTAPDTVTPQKVGSGSFQAPPTGQFQFTAPWFTSVGTSMPPPSGFAPPPSSAAPFSNATHQQPPPLNPTNFGSQPLSGFNFPPQNPTLVPPRLQHPPQVNPCMSQPRPSDVNAPMSNPTPFPFSGSQPLQSAPFSRPLLSQHSVNPPPLSFQSGPSIQNSLPLQPNHPPLHSNFPSQMNPLPSRSLAPPFQPGPSSFSGPTQNFPLTRPSVVSAPHPNSGDFTFQPHHPNSSQNFPPRPGNRPPPHLLPANQPLPPPPPPQFHSDLHHQMQQPFSRPPMHHPNRQSFQNHGPSQPPIHQLGQQMNYGAANPGPAFPARPRNFMEPQQMYRGQMAPRDILPPPNQHFRHNPSFGGPYNRAPGPGELQVYDPFSPTSVANMRPRQEDNSGITRRQENDPEYEDLMASVGVK